MHEKNCNYNNETNIILQTLSPSLQDSIKKFIEKENYVQYKVAIKTFNTHGDNISGELYEIDIRNDTDGNHEDTHLFVKQMVLTENFTLFSITNFYSKEAFFYKDISKIFTSLQDQANVPHEDRYKIAKAYDAINCNIIILENLAKRGFKTHKKMKTISIKYAELAIKELAKFHALSFVIESKMPEYHDNKIKVLNTEFRFNEDWKVLIRSICSQVAKLYDNEVKGKIENFVPVFMEKFKNYNRDKTSIKCSLTHGDYKKNNVLVREEDGEPVEVVPIDYQTLDYGCPLRDFFFFVFAGSDQEFRRKHLNDLKELYFTTVSRFLKYFDLDVETVYPRKEFERVYTEWLDYGLMIALISSVFTFTSDTGADLQNVTQVDLPYSTNKYYERIIRGLIDDFVQWGYL